MLAHSSAPVHSLNPNQQSPYRFFGRLMCWRWRLMHYKNFPQLNSFTIRLMIFNAIKFFFLRYIRRQRAKYYYAFNIGAIPDKEKSNWYKTTSDHYIASPCFPSHKIRSAMAYMLTLPGAIKWKKIVLRNNVHIDEMFHHSYNKKEMNLRLVVPPCCLAPNIYLKYSTRRIR